MLEMAQYEADKVIALLQFCCWKHREIMNNTGLRNLRDKLVFFIEEDLVENGGKEIKVPNEKYLVDLLSDANSASKKDNLIHKSKTHMNFLLEFGSFDSWETWELCLHQANEFISSETMQLSDFSVIEIGISFPTVLEKKLLSNLAFARKTSEYPLHLLPLQKESILEYLSYTRDLLKEYPFIIGVIPLQWNNQLDVLNNPLWKEMLQSGRVLPVWIDELNSWQIHPSRVPWLKNHQVIGGLTGLLCGILYIHEVVKRVNHTGINKSRESPKSMAIPQIQNLKNNKGVVLLGNFRTENTAMGDITIHNYRNTKKDDTDY